MEKLAPHYGHTVDTFIEMNQAHLLWAEAAGAGVAASVALASQFHGQEVSSIQALIAAGINLAERQADLIPLGLSQEAMAEAADLCAAVWKTLAEQAEGWKERNLFERQWVMREFKKNAAMPVEGWLDGLERLDGYLRAGDAVRAQAALLPLDQLAAYYDHLGELAKGYEKDPQVLAENLAIIQGWQEEVERLIALLGT